MLRHALIASAVVLVIVAVISFFPGCSSDDCPTCPTPPEGVILSSQVLTPQPLPSYYADLFVAGPQDVFISTSQGVVLRRQGTTWTEYDTGVVSTLLQIWGTSATDVFAVGSQGVIVHFDGSTWQTMESGVLYTLEAVHGTASDNVYAVGSGGTVIHYDGSRWSTVDTGFAGDNRSCFDVWCAPTGEVFVAVAFWSPPYDGVMLVFDGVSTWTSEIVGGDHVTVVWGTARDNVWAGNSNGDLYLYDGSDWTHSHNMPDYIASIHGTAANDIWAAGACYISGCGAIGQMIHFDGSSWSSAGPMMSPPAYQAVAAHSTDEAYAVHSSALITAWDGTEWSPANDEWVTDQSLQVIWGSAHDDFWTIGERSSAFHYDGTGWTGSYAGTQEVITAVWGAAADNIYAVGTNGAIVHYDGNSWSEVSHGLGTDYLREIWGSASDDIWVSCDSGQMWHYDGTSWSRIDVWPSEFGTARSLWGIASDDFYAVVSGGVVHYDGTNWNPVGMGGNVARTVHGVSATEVYFTTSPGGFGLTATGRDDVARPPALGGTTLIRYNGTDYSVMAEHIDANFHTMWALGHNNLFLAGDRNGAAVVGHFDGSRVVLDEPNTHTWIGDMWGTGSGTVYLCGGSGTVIRTTKN
jgi:hypothetical protein